MRSAAAACLTFAREAYRVEDSPKSTGIDSVRLNLLGHRGANDLFRARRPA